jgi:hypothetical protein
MRLKRSKSKPRGRVPDSLGPLWRFLEARRDAWVAANAAIERRDVVVVDGARWTMFRKIHANRIKGARSEKLDFRASITIWPGTTIKSAGLARFRGISKDTPTMQAWRRQLERKIRRQGYRGRWRRFPGGQFGDFWKTLSDARAVRAEVKLLDSLRL